MLETSRANTGPARNSTQSFLRLVREACDVLFFAHPSVAQAVTISRPLEGNNSARLAAKMAARLAEEYNLDVDVRIEGTTVVVRIARNAGHIHKERKLPHRVPREGRGAGGGDM